MMHTRTHELTRERVALNFQTRGVMMVSERQDVTQVELCNGGINRNWWQRTVYKKGKWRSCEGLGVAF